VNVPVIASGGAGTVQHFVKVFKQGGASAALAASIFHDGLLTVAEVKSGLIEAGLPIRWGSDLDEKFEVRKDQNAD
jgi:cyclase